jgi:hypothetical protein
MDYTARTAVQDIRYRCIADCDFEFVSKHGRLPIIAGLPVTTIERLEG